MTQWPAYRGIDGSVTTLAGRSRFDIIEIHGVHVHVR